MKYKVKITPSALKPVKRQSREFKERIYKETQNLAEAPFAHEQLKPPLSMCRSYHFKYKGTSFRIAYTIDQEEGKIIIVLIGPREGFYDTLRRKLH